MGTSRLWVVGGLGVVILLMVAMSHIVVDRAEQRVWRWLAVVTTLTAGVAAWVLP